MAGSKRKDWNSVIATGSSHQADVQVVPQGRRVALFSASWNSDTANDAWSLMDGGSSGDELLRFEAELGSLSGSWSSPVPVLFTDGLYLNEIATGSAIINLVYADIGATT